MDTHPIFNPDMDKLNIGQSQCPYCGMIGSTALAFMNEHWENCRKHPKRNLNSIGDVIDYIKNDCSDQYGRGLDKQFYLVVDWGDRRIVFLEKDLDNPHQKDLDRYDEKRDTWPANSYDGKERWSAPLHDELVTDLLDYMNIEYLG